MGTLDLSIAALSLSLKNFTTDEYPRIGASGQENNVIYTATGSIAGNGKSHEPKHLWSINVVCTATEEALLNLIWAEHDYLRRTNADANILVYDKTQYFYEQSPRSRALAPTTTATNYPTVSPTHVYYFAQFKAWMPERPKFSNSGVKRIASFTLLETDKVSA